MTKIIFSCNSAKENSDTNSKLKFSYGFEVLELENESDILQCIKGEIIDFVILDLDVKNFDAILLCSEIKEMEQRPLPSIIIVSSKADDYIQTLAFDSGADGFMQKPLKASLVASRINAISRRKSEMINHKVNNNIYNLMIDTERHLVTINSREILLPKKEFNLLNLLYSNSEKVFSRTEIAKHIWGDPSVGEPKRRTIDVHLSNIRSKIGVNFIRTVNGVGYSINLNTNNF